MTGPHGHAGWSRPALAGRDRPPSRPRRPPDSRSRSQVKKGLWAKLQPHKMAFVDLAAAVGPREVLEVAFRNYR